MIITEPWFITPVDSATGELTNEYTATDFVVYVWMHPDNIPYGSYVSIGSRETKEKAVALAKKSYRRYSRYKAGEKEE